ncbi:hypothetical protein N0B31_10025 [Salinirubellus salinus]|uniref:Uncharacterized protein n=1 Tax=Salinirubellus salinus TaxID=1364945 RepID=A0A9E7UCT1_9EURY|nr:hypothetical protein [Salinirubellus salinus]UWM56612.1 hypothetical protein N0B31_10025 [Salinirubellus salinus]
MQAGRLAATLTVAVVLVTSLLSGPLVGAADLSPAPEVDDSFGPGQGSMNVTVHSVPDEARLVQSDFGAGAYFLRLDSADVTLSNVVGQPILVYKLRVSGLVFVSSRNTFVTEADEGRMTVPFAEDTVQRERVNESVEEYPAEIVVGVLANDEERVVHRTNVTVEVKR